MNNKLVNLKKMTMDALKGKYAILHINIINIEWIVATLQAAEELKSPIVLAVSESSVKYQKGFDNVFHMVNNIMEFMNITVPVVLHLDHGTYDGAIKALKAGFTSVMFDGSNFDFEENLKRTSEIVEIAKKFNASVEAEVGSIGGEEDGVVGVGELANIDECEIISKLGIDVLAAGIGNIHGVYPSNWKGLSFETLNKIHSRIPNVPLVLHGGTGIPVEQVKKAIQLGMVKINVGTECQIVFQKAIRKYIEEGRDLQGKGFDPRKLLAPGVEAINNLVKEKILLCNSANKI